MKTTLFNLPIRPRILGFSIMLVLLNSCVSSSKMRPGDIQPQGIQNEEALPHTVAEDTPWEGTRLPGGGKNRKLRRRRKQWKTQSIEVERQKRRADTELEDMRNGQEAEPDTKRMHSVTEARTSTKRSCSDIVKCLLTCFCMGGAEALGERPLGHNALVCSRRGSAPLARLQTSAQQQRTTRVAAQSATNNWSRRGGELTNGKYTVNKEKMKKHIYDLGMGRSVFYGTIDAEQEVLKAAEYADKYDLWNGIKAKVRVSNKNIGTLGTGEPTNYINLYRKKNNQIHGSPGNPPAR